MNETTRAVITALEQRGGDATRLHIGHAREDYDEMLILKVVNKRSLRNAVKDILAVLKEEGLAYSIERDSNWTAIGVGDNLIHVFTPETARFYRLDQLWAMCPQSALA